MKNYDTYFKDLTTWKNLELASTTIVIVCVQRFIKYNKGQNVQSFHVV